EKIEFMRVRGRLTPGEYVFKEEGFLRKYMAPYLEVGYRIRPDGHGDMRVKCKKLRTSRLSFKLFRCTKGLQYDHYAVKPADMTLINVRFDEGHRSYPSLRTTNFVQTWFPVFQAHTAITTALEAPVSRLEPDPPLFYDDLFTRVGRTFREAAWISGCDDSLPPAGIEYGDFVTIVNSTKSADFISVFFRGGQISLMRDGRNMSPGKYKYRSSCPPKVKGAYKVRDDGDVRLRVECGRRGAGRFRFKLSERFRPQQTSKYYALERKSLPKGRWDDLKAQARLRRACPRKQRVLEADDLKQLVVCTDTGTVIFVKFLEARLGKAALPSPGFEWSIPSSGLSNN
ncbi:hypothetical protein FOZ63_003739, partial [Perkinsus olseni]